MFIRFEVCLCVDQLQIGFYLNENGKEVLNIAVDKSKYSIFPLDRNFSYGTIY